MTEHEIEYGQMVYKNSGDYTFKGKVVCVFKKRNGVKRCVVENDEGILHIFNPGQLALQPE